MIGYAAVLPLLSVALTLLQIHSTDEAIPPIDQNRISFDSYPTYQEVSDYVNRLARNYPEFVKVTVEGSTHENRSLYLVELGGASATAINKAVWIDGGIHAREWIAVTTALYVIDQLVSNHLNRDVSSPTANVIWYIMPLANPDGYEHSRTKERLWRKNRHPTENPDCLGVDLNRNFDVVGFGVGASDDPCGGTFKGVEKNSEPETQAITRAILRHKGTLKAAMAFHSHGQKWLTSWGYTNELAPDNDRLIRWGERAAAAIKGVHGENYTVARAGAGLYLAGGASDDFSKAVAGVPYVATVELRDNGKYGFELPPTMIRLVGEEIWAAMQVVAQTALKTE